jgi:glucosyl-3-phosphoglycerate phosphatase
VKRLLLVRHGESEWNKERRLQGQADIALSPHGRSQAMQLRPVIASLAPDSILTSDLQRARETAALLGYQDAEPCVPLREIDVGDWTGRPIAEIENADLAAYRGWRAGRFTPPRGEDWAVFKDRTCAVVRRCLTGDATKILLVAHGGVIRAVLEGLLGLEPARIVPVGPASLTVLKHSRDEMAAFKLELFNFSPAGPAFDSPD